MMAFQKMRKNIFFATLMAFGLMFVAACNQDKCKDKDCGNGDCSDVDGTCICATGFEQDVNGSCTTRSRDKFLATYTVQDTFTRSNGTNDVASYNSTLSAVNGDLVKINISSIYDGFFTNPVVATADGNTITIAKQIPDNDGVSVEGTGTYSATGVNLRLTYTLTDNIGPITRRASFRK